MEQIRVEHLTFSYGNESTFSLKDITTTIPKGQFVLIIGESGCGKTTLLRHFKVDYLPAGIRSEQAAIYINGMDTRELPQRDKAGLVGFVRQDPESSQVMDKVWHELAFGLESLGYPQEQMQRKVAEMVAFFGLESIYDEKLCNLSGGQKQLVNLASVMVMEPEVLVLDEPTSQLDPVAATQFFGMVERIHRELGTTIVMTEHRLEEVYGLCDRVLVMERGSIVCDDTPEQAAVYLWRQGKSMFDALPSSARIYLQLNSVSTKEKTMTVSESTEYEAGKPSQEEWQKSLVYADQAVTGQVPLTVKDGRNWLADILSRDAYTRDKNVDRCATDPMASDLYSPIRNKQIYPSDRNKNDCEDKRTGVIHAEELWFRYEAKGADALKACSLSPEQGRITAILGGNGAGKSTLLHVLAGHYKPIRGKIRRQNGKIAMLPQNPQVLFAKDTVWEELCVSAGVSTVADMTYVKRENSDVSGSDSKADVKQQRYERLDKLISTFGLQEVLEQHPFDLSGGQMQKLALAKLILADYDILLLDEPGKGMDYQAKHEMGSVLRQLTDSGKTIVMVSHDVEFCAKYADICGLFFDGHIVSLMETRSFFLQNVFYTTAVCRVCRNLLDSVVTVEDVLSYFGKKDRKTVSEIGTDGRAGEGKRRGIGRSETDIKYSQILEDDSQYKKHKAKTDKNNLSAAHRIVQRQDIDKKGKNRILIFAAFFLCMAFTIYLGHTVLQQRKYYFVSLLLILEALGAFFVSFEKGKPKLKEMMTISIMTAITVAGRAAFYMVPNVKPMAALTILSGIGLGGEAGFLVGSLSMLISNIFFGQGPWTPWQMVAMGLLGWLAGILFRNESSCSWKKVGAICVFGFLSVLLVYGGIMNPASVLMYQEQVNRAMILSAYAMGVPFDLLHACGTVIFLLIGTRPILKKLFRIQKGGN